MRRRQFLLGLLTSAAAVAPGCGKSSRESPFVKGGSNGSAPALGKRKGARPKLSNT
jgi:hypothetical protein